MSAICPYPVKKKKTSVRCHYGAKDLFWLIVHTTETLLIDNCNM